MITRGTKRRFSSVALVLLASLLVFGIAAPIIVSVSSNRITVSSSTLVAAPRDSTIITAPTLLGASKLVSVERGLLYPSDNNGRALDRPLSRAQLAGGNSRFIIENGVLRIGGDAGAAKMEADALLLNAIGGLQFDALSLRKSTLLINLPDGRTETLSEIDADVSHRRKTSLAIKGQGELRGQRVNFDVVVGIAGESRPGASVPIKFSIKSALADIAFDGKVAFGGPAQLQGGIEFKAPNVRQIARWFGAPWPTGNGLRNLQGQGQLAWAGPDLALNRAAILMDGNEATGTLNLNFTGARPSIGGTLATKSFDLGRYFPGQALSLPGVTAGVWSRLLSADLSLPLAHHVDTDLRLSADKVQLGSLQFGRAAAAVTISNGRMLTDVGAFEFDGGKGGGQLIADMSGIVPRFTVRGRLEEVDAQRISGSLFGHSLLNGKATVTTDIAFSGRAGDDLLSSAAGKLNIAMRTAGRIGIDLQSLATTSSKRAVDGWGPAGRGTMPFDEFSAAFAVRSGSLVAEDVKWLSGATTTVLSGLIDVPANRLNVTVVQLAPSTRGSAPDPAALPTLSLQIFGPWRAPTVRNEIGRERAADPSMPSAMPEARL